MAVSVTSISARAAAPASTEPADLLRTNLTALGERNADVARRIAGIAADPTVAAAPTPQDLPAFELQGAPLCSRHRPIDEAERLADSIDLVENAVVVCLGFGAGYHVRHLAQRMEKTGVIVVYEPDLALTRAIFEQVDHSHWLNDAIVVWMTDSDDRAALNRKLQGAETILAQGVAFLPHPPSRARLGDDAAAFSRTVAEFIASAKTTLATTLVRSVETVRNNLLNLDHYVIGDGIAELKDAAAGRPAVIVSAGPSLHRNMSQLAEPGVRENAVIVAVQTTLKPLLEAGVRPHFVTALDYHEISRRFYEGLDADSLQDTTLIAEPKAHPVILDSYPGPIRCCASPFLDALLGAQKRDMGALPAGSTVAHLAMYFARHLGCDPIILIGQDLGFPDGLYYAPGTAIHDVWSPELNPFNTIAMMEWQRIARHRVHLHKLSDIEDKSIYTDAQMLTYLHQFERDFAKATEDGVTIIDATEGGVAKQHTTPMPLREALTEHATKPQPPLPVAQPFPHTETEPAARGRLADVRREVTALRDLSRQTVSVIEAMLRDQRDEQKMHRHFRRIEQHRRQVERRMEFFELLNHLNQLGVFRRMKADRRLHVDRPSDPFEYQKRQLERDLQNVTWLIDAAEELIDQLGDADRVLAGRPVSRRATARAPVSDDDRPPSAVDTCISALVPIDPERNGLGVKRSLERPFRGRPVLQATLERLGECALIESIILLVPRGFEIERLIDRDTIHLPVEIEWIDGTPFGPEHEAIAAARRWSDTCWRGGIAGMSIYDEVLCPAAMHAVMHKRGLTAALIAGPDWPLIEPSSEHGCDAVVRRHLENPEKHNLVFTQNPPGLCGCVISASLMAEWAQRNRLATVGGLLVYQPHAPQGDPIAKDANVQIDHRLRPSQCRATFDAPRYRERIAALGPEKCDSLRVVEALDDRGLATLPQHVILEITTKRNSHGLLRTQWRDLDRPDLPITHAARLFTELAEAGDAVVTFAGAGDPLLHPQFDEFIHAAKDAGILGVHLRTELWCDAATIDKLLGCPLDVLSIDLHADRSATYETMMGEDRLPQVLRAIETIVAKRRKLTDHRGTAALGLPWIVPLLQRRAETYEDIDSFFDRWQHLLGAAVIEPAPPHSHSHSHANSNCNSNCRDTLIPAVTPRRVIERELMKRMVVHCDGSIPVDEFDHGGERCVGRIGDRPLTELWRDLMKARIDSWKRSEQPRGLWL